MESTQDSSAGDPRDDIYTGAGFQLRTAREEQGLSLSDIATRTRVPLRQLEVIEAGAFDALPSRTYAIGFARTYCRAVGLDEEPVIAAVRDELGDSSEPRTPVASEMEPGDPAKLPSKGLAVAAAIAAAVLALGLFAWFGSYFGAGKGAAPLVAEASEDAPTGAAGPVADDAGATPAAPSATGEVVFTALEDGVWVRLYEQGGARLFERQLAKGENFAVPSDASDPRLNTGRPDALAITIDGTPAARLAERAINLGDAQVSAAALLARSTDAAPVRAPARTAAPTNSPAPAQSPAATPTSAPDRTPAAARTPAASSSPAPSPAPPPARSGSAAATPAPAPAPSPATTPTPSPTSAPVTPAPTALTPVTPAPATPAAAGRANGPA